MSKKDSPSIVWLWTAAVLLLSACSQSSDTAFTRLKASKTGIDFNNRLVEDEELNVLNYTYFYNGGGVAAGDLNNDGLCDLIFTGNMVKNRLYLNKGDLSFDDITDQSGIAAAEGWCTGVTLTDINSDGWLDIYICRSADIEPSRRRNLLYINNHDLTFTERAAEYGIADAGYSTQGSFFDYDRDGDLDLIVINHSLQQYTSGAQENPALRTQRNPDYATRLYKNDGLRFRDVTDSAGIISNVLSFGLGVAVSDLNNDGWPDIYISNDFNEQDYCFLNNQDGTFREKSREMFAQMSLYSMGSDAADLNNDGLMDLVTLDMLPESNYLQKMHSGAENYDKFQVLFWNGFHYQYSRNMLQLNNGTGQFSEIGQYAGISNTDWSWAALAGDYDNDGKKDLFITNGYVKDYTDMDFLKYSADRAAQGASDKRALVAELLEKMPTIKLSNYLFRNEGEARFSNVSASWGMDEPGISAGAIYADLDNDGDLDLVSNNSNETAGVYRNNSRNTSYVQFSLKSKGSNTAGIGAKVSLFQKNGTQVAELVPTRGFQSSVEPIIHFGLGADTTGLKVRVRWPDGTLTEHPSIAVNKRQELNQESGLKITEEVASFRPWFTVDTLPAVHKENTHNDFAVQPLLPAYYSRQGPAMANADINGDGLVDLFIGGAKDQSGTILLQQRSGRFQVLTQPALAEDAKHEDISAAFLDADRDGDQDLFVGSGGYEVTVPELLQNRLYLNDGKGRFSKAIQALPPDQINDQAVAVADFNGDGYPDIYHAGFCKPGLFPTPDGAQLLLNNGRGQFAAAKPEWLPKTASGHLLTAAAASDFNKDGKPDLLLVGHWMSPILLLNAGTSFTDASSTWGLDSLRGSYNTAYVADIDRDGKPDVLLGNQGTNNPFRATVKEPMSLHTSDFDGNGIQESFLSYYINGQSWPAHSRDDLMAQVPLYNKRFLFYKDYANADLTTLVGLDALKQASVNQIEELHSLVLENTGKTFSRHNLPAAVQWAPMYAFTGLGFAKNKPQETYWLAAGNQSFTRIRYGRFNASQGVIFKHTGNFNFEVIYRTLNGLVINGDTRHLCRTGKGWAVAINDKPAIQIQLTTDTTIINLVQD